MVKGSRSGRSLECRDGKQGLGGKWTAALGTTLLLLAAGALLAGSNHFGSREARLRTSASSVLTSRVSASSASAAPALLPSPSPTLQNSLQNKKTDATSVLAQLPLIFEPNQGQADAGVRFLSHGAGYGLSLNETGVLLGIQTAPAAQRGGKQFVRMSLVGANAHSEMAGIDRLRGKSNYFMGNDPRQWHSGIPQFAGVRYKSVYPGIDLVFYGNRGRLEYDFRVAPGADPSRAVLQFDRAAKLQMHAGNLLVAENIGGKNEAVLRLQAPQIYQHDGERRRKVDGRFVLSADNRVAFEVGNYDRRRELIIDPALDFSSYFGQIVAGTAPQVAVNGDGSIYLAGSTTTASVSSFPTATTTTSLGTTSNIFISKITPSSPAAVVYTTFLGGNGTDTLVGLGVDYGGDLYIAGNTTSTNFPTTSLSYQTAPAGKTQCTAGTSTCTSLFATSLPAGGLSLSYSSYLSGNGDDSATGVAIDTSKNIFITGTTTSTNTPSSTVAFPASFTPVPFQTTPLSSPQFFVTKVNTTIPGTSSVAYSTYFGATTPKGGTIATGGGIAVDSTGNIYFSGTTNFYNSGNGLFGNYSESDDFPILNAFQPCLDTVPATVEPLESNPCSAPTTLNSNGTYPSDAFVAKIYPLAQAGAQLLFSTYFGGANTDTSTAVIVDSGAANVYITGATNSSALFLPTGTTAFQTCLNNPTTTPCPTTNANTDAYIARFTNPATSTTTTTSNTPNFAELTYFTYLGGGGNEAGNAISVDTAADALVTGYTTSGAAAPPSFPTTTGAIQTTLNGTQNAFFAHINTAATTVSQIGNYSTYFGGNGVDSGTSITIDPNANTYFAGSTTSTNLQAADALQTAFNAPGPDAFVVKLGTASDLCITCVAPVISPSGTVSAGNEVTITFNVTNNGPDVATGVNVTGQVPTGVAINSAGVTASSSGTSSTLGTCSAPQGTIVICQIPTLQAGASTVITFVVTPQNAGTYEVMATVSNPSNTNTNTVSTASFTASAFEIGIAPSSQTVSAGQSAQFSVNVAPLQGVFGANVSLTCSALPSGASCNFTTSTLSLSNGQGSASTALNISTTAQPVATASAPWHGPLYALWLTVPGMTLIGLGVRGKKRRRSWILGIIALATFFVLAMMQPACSKGVTQPTVSGTPSGTYPLTVTATSGSLTKTAPFSLTVIP
jgi:hypothetical protein